MAGSALWPGMTVHEELGIGSSGKVFRVCVNGNTYAMKQIRIPPEDMEQDRLIRILGSREAADAFCKEAKETLLHEMRILWKFRNDPHIVSVKDYRIVELHPGYELDLLMECLTPFPEYVRTHLMGEEEVIELGTDLCSALETCEKAGVIHLDLKTDNILVTRSGTFKVCDFGIAGKLEELLPTAPVKGSFSFMAPEVYRGKKYDQRADIYSLGLILYRTMNQGQEPFLAFGEPCYSSREKEMALNRRMNGKVLPKPRAASEALANIILKACAFDPEDRYSSASSFKEALLGLRKDKERPPEKRG